MANQQILSSSKFVFSEKLLFPVKIGNVITHIFTIIASNIDVLAIVNTIMIAYCPKNSISL